MEGCIALIQKVSETGECVWNMDFIYITIAVVAGIVVLGILIKLIKSILQRRKKRKLELHPEAKVFCPNCRVFVKTVMGKCPYCGKDLRKKKKQ